MILNTVFYKTVSRRLGKHAIIQLNEDVTYSLYPMATKMRYLTRKKKKKKQFIRPEEEESKNRTSHCLSIFPRFCGNRMH